MRTLGDVHHQLAYHPATAESAPKHAAVRQVLIDTATQLWQLVPDGPEKTLAMRRLQECGMYCNLAIALPQDVDLDHPHIARQLPAEPQPTHPDGTPIPTPDQVGSSPSTTTSSEPGSTASSPTSGGFGNAAPSAEPSIGGTPGVAASDPTG